ncbi:MAG TPA: hypothetical protein VNH11_12615 [Pirellulales bacterium]|nr:hypothetical protein [Pirellulales bacterium]
MLRVGPVVFSAFVCLSLLPSMSAAEPDTAARPLPTPRQAAILTALDQPSELDFAEQPLSDVIESLKQKHEIEIQIDNKALADAGVASDTPITHTIQGITLRSLLRLVLSELDLTYVVGDGFLLITSKTEAENHLTCRIYPVEDLVTLDSEFRPPLRPGQKKAEDARALIELIVSTMAPRTWDEVGGPGSIKFVRNSHALAISQAEEAHEEIAELLAALRRTRDKQIEAAKPLDPFAGRPPAPSNEPLQIKEPLPIKVYHLAQRAAPAKPTQAAAPPGQQPVGGAKAAAPAKEQNNVALVAAPPADSPSPTKLEAWAKAIAKLVPEMIEPQSWEPTGEGMIRAAGETVVVRQTDEIQYRVGKLIEGLLPGSVASTVYPAVRLSLAGSKGGWPQMAEPEPGAREARIQKELGQLTEIDFAEQPLSDVIEYLKQRHGIDIQLDSKALTDAGVNSDTPITRRIKGITLRALLRLTLDELDLTYVIRNEVLMITSKTEAENMLLARVYPVFDLVVRPPDAPADRPALDFPALIDNITNNLVPTTWDEVGGPGAIEGFTNAGALVITQTTAAHDEIVEYLKALRDARAAR